jgi:acyl-coenzyme A synthetase/AMP-(fatty) acid ligase
MNQRRLRNIVTSPAQRQNYLSKRLWTEETLAEMVADHAARKGSAVAVVDRLGQRRVAYSELDHDASRVGAYLAGMGVEPGDVVAVQLPNCYEAVAIAIGVLRVGAVINPMLPVYRSKELRHMLVVGQAKVLFTPAIYRGFDFIAMVEQLRADIPTLGAHVVLDGNGGHSIGLDEALRTAPIGGDRTRVAAADVSELIFTSGTEADPKAILHTEQTTNFSVRAAYSSLRMTDRDVVWMPSPIGHSTGFNYGVRMALYHGLKLVLQDRWDGNEAADLIEAEGCSYTLAATTFLRDLVDACKERPRRVASMHRFGSGGAPVPPELVASAAEHEITVLRLYGSTEVLVGSWNRPESPIQKRVDTDGLPIDGVEIAIRDEDGGDVTRGAGEIFVRGPNTSVGFLEDPDRMAATFDSDDWVKSGDLGVVDAEGYLTVVGRKKEIIIRGGLNVAPREVEEVLLRLPSVAAVAVVGLPNERLGEIGCACVVLQGTARLTFDEMIEFLRKSGLAVYKWPEQLEIVTEIPMTLTGKIRKHMLVAQLTQRTTPSTVYS